VTVAGPGRTGVLATLQSLREQFEPVQGSIVASTDGIVLAHDLGGAETFGTEPSGVAALCAVNLGLSQRVADTASYGGLRHTVIRGTFGQVITCAAGDRALLTVLVATPDEVVGLADSISRAADDLTALLIDVWDDDAAHWHATA
jgi:predicted regulator of Ras-like GTPase activity (Roadblock/LC7/MglB family)